MNYKLFGVNLTTGSRSAVLAAIKALVGVGGAVFTVNSLMLERALGDGSFRTALNSADICTVDGVGVKRALAMQGVATEILTGVDLGELAVEDGAPSIALIGGREGIAERAFHHLKSINPRLRKSLVLSGYGINDSEYLAALAKARPDLCFVCLGSPKQEYFVLRAREVSPKTLFFALGGSLDVYSGKKRRAPKFMRAAGLEWLARMIREPRRIKELPRLLAFAVRSLKMANNQQKSASEEEKIP